jgi:multiple PDZ domain protein
MQYMWWCTGITVDAVDQAAHGCVLRTITPSGAVGKDGRLRSGDLITSINHENMRHISNAQGRAIIRRASLLVTDIRLLLPCTMMTDVC